MDGAGRPADAGARAHSLGTGEDEVDPLPGSIVEQYIRCGKPKCRCRDGDEKHGPYYYRVWREAGRVRKVYIPTADVERVRAQCDLYRHYRERLAHARARLREMSARLDRTMRQGERLRWE